VYAALGLPWLPPEIRDGDDELARAAGGESFADLITLADVRGAVHCHTTYSDGRASIEQMALAAHERGLAYLTITDHSVSAHYAGGLDAAGLRAQWLELAEVQARTPLRLLRGTESDILADGSLDYDAGLLGELDVVIASVHHRHQLDEDGMTRRLVAAMRQPVFKIWGHALGRLVLRRDPIACRFDEVLDAIVDGPAAIELNGDPHRLDLDPVRARAAHARGVRFVLSSDAHSTRELDNLEWAVAMARRARLRPRDVLNTLPPDEFAAAVRPAPR
jgi:DNA polymerase (family 10)